MTHTFEARLAKRDAIMEQLDILREDVSGAAGALVLEMERAATWAEARADAIVDNKNPELPPPVDASAVCRALYAFANLLHNATDEIDSAIATINEGE